MATVNNTLKMNDSMGSVIKSIVRDMDIAIGTMERLDSASSRLDLGGGLSASGTAGLHKGILMLDGSIHEVASAQQTVNNRIRDGTAALDAAAAAGAGLKHSLDPIDDEIRHSNEEQRKFNKQIKSGTDAAGDLRSMLAKVGAVIGIRQIGAVSDSYTLIGARLGLIKGEMETVDQLQDKTFASANKARGLYTDMAGSVSKLALLAGDAFGNNNDEIIRFVELYQKMGTIGGSSASEVSNAMYQLNQAMASGRLQGDEYRSIIENAPMLASAIEDYMINVQHAKGSMKDWASDGLLTADVIKAAMFSVADTVDETFEKMPMTWAQLWNVIVNHIMVASEPLLRFINLLANNWSILGPIVYGVVAALGAYLVVKTLFNAQLAIANTLEAVSAARATLAAGATLAKAAATTTATGAQVGFNAALMACPITWIIIGIIALIAIFYAAVAAVNKFAGTSLSATGLIVGAVFVAGAAIANTVIGLLNALIQFVWAIFAEPFLGIVEWILNVTNGGFDSFGAAVANLIGQIISWFLSLGKVVTTIIDAIFGTEWTAGLSSLQDSVLSWGKNDNAITLDRSAPTIDHRFTYGGAWDKGYGIGSGLQDKVVGLFGGEGLGLDDLTSSLGDQEYDVKVKDDVNLADESLEYLLDAVTQRYVNNVNVTSPAPTVQVTFAGDIHRDVDLDELAERTKRKIGTGLVEYAMSSTDIKR